MLKLLRNLKPFTFSVVLIILFMFLQALAQLYLPTLMADIVDTGVVKGDTTYIMKIGGFMLLVSAGSLICSILGSFFSSRVSTGFSRDLRERYFTHVENFSLTEFDHIGTASLITRATNDVTQIQQMMTMLLRMFLRAPLLCVGGIIMAISKDAKLSLIFFISIPVLAIAIFFITRAGMPLFKAIQVKLDRINRVMREGLTGFRVIRAFNRQDYEQKRFDEANSDLTNTAIKVNKIVAFMGPVMTIVLNFSIIFIMWFGSIRVDQGSIQVGDLMAFIQYAMQILFALMMFSMMFVMLPRASASAARVNEVLNMEPDITTLKEKTSSSKTKGLIEFDDVTFTYPGAEQPALEHISFKAKDGETTAIIGGTGSGKTTLANLIPRFYDVDQGSIRVDDVDIREMSQEYLRGKIGYAPQKAILFSGTIADNIRYGKDEATEDDVEHALEVAQASEFVADMKDGIQTMISQGGTNLSGGQKQRLAIARAIAKKPEIYIFDDSFSALDFKTDRYLRDALKDEVKDATVIIIAQRVNTIIDADRIIVMENGQMVGVGTHEELLQTCDPYKEIVESQGAEGESA